MVQLYMIVYYKEIVHLLFLLIEIIIFIQIQVEMLTLFSLIKTVNTFLRLIFIITIRFLKKIFLKMLN